MRHFEGQRPKKTTGTSGINAGATCTAPKCGSPHGGAVGEWPLQNFLHQSPNHPINNSGGFGRSESVVTAKIVTGDVGRSVPRNGMVCPEAPGNMARGLL
jgi:hypothetical protein